MESRTVAALRSAAIRAPSRLALLAFVGSVLATCAFWLVVPPSFGAATPEAFANLNSDYRPQLLALLTGHGTFSARYPPGFPLLLAGVYDAARALHLPVGWLMAAFVLACTGLAASLLYRLARTVWPAPAALGAVALWSTYPLPLWLTTYPSPETPFMPALFGAVLLFWLAVMGGRGEERADRARVFGGGVLAGVAMLIRPIALCLVVVLPVMCWFLCRRLPLRARAALVALFVAGSVLTVAPWELWVGLARHRVVLLSSGGVPSMLDGLTYAVDAKDHRHVRVSDDVAALQRDVLARQYRELNSTGSIAAYLERQLAVRPAAVVKLFAAKAAASWYATDSTRYDRYVLLLQLLYAPLVLLGTWGAWRAGGDARRLAIVAWVVAIAFWGMTILVLSISRYLTPALGPLFALVPGARALRRERALPRESLAGE